MMTHLHIDTNKQQQKYKYKPYSPQFHSAPTYSIFFFPIPLVT